MNIRDVATGSMVSSMVISASSSCGRDIRSRCASPDRRVEFVDFVGTRCAHPRRTHLSTLAPGSELTPRGQTPAPTDRNDHLLTDEEQQTGHTDGDRPSASHTWRSKRWTKPAKLNSRGIATLITPASLPSS